MNNFAVNVPINQVSFGFVSIALLREMYKAGYLPCVFPIGNIDLSTQKEDRDFYLWLQNCVNRSYKFHHRNNPSVKLWHLSDLISSVSKEQVAITFLEVDSCSDYEINVINQQKTMFVTSRFTKDVMEEAGAQNVKYLELGFDSYNFYDTKKTYLNNDVVVFGLAGKLEPHRKAHQKILSAWAKKYGNNRKYVLHAALYNVFLKPEDQNNIVNQILGGTRYWNINFLPYMKTNVEYNDFLNSINIMIGCSRGEGRDLPVYHAIGLGKHCVGLRAHAYLDYLNDDNAVLINPTGKVKAVDGMFFHENSPWNTGNFYDWDADDFISACDIAIKKFETNRLNTKGLELQQKTYKQTLGSILDIVHQ